MNKATVELVLKALEESVKYAKIELDDHLEYEKSIYNGTCNPCCRPSLNWAECVTDAMKTRYDKAQKTLAEFNAYIIAENEIKELCQD